MFVPEIVGFGLLYLRETRARFNRAQQTWRRHRSHFHILVHMNRTRLQLFKARLGLFWTSTKFDLIFCNFSVRFSFHFFVLQFWLQLMSNSTKISSEKHFIKEIFKPGESFFPGLALIGEKTIIDCLDNTLVYFTLSCSKTWCWIFCNFFLVVLSLPFEMVFIWFDLLSIFFACIWFLSFSVWDTWVCPKGWSKNKGKPWSR